MPRTAVERESFLASARQSRYPVGMTQSEPLKDLACTILGTADPAEKARLSRMAAAAWRASADHPVAGDGPIMGDGQVVSPPNRPARPARPELRPPQSMPHRKITSGTKARGRLLHALAHIELNAIDLAWDMIARFAACDLPRPFFDDWVRVADEEALHFTLLADRLQQLGCGYGDFPAHDGLWQAAADTAHDLLARLAVVPMVLEARGLDVTPQMIDRLMAVGDADSAAILQRIHDDEIGHVAIGHRWFHWEAARRGLVPLTTWQALVRRHFRGPLKPPFNSASRARAGFAANYYEPLADSGLRFSDDATGQNATGQEAAHA